MRHIVALYTSLSTFAFFFLISEVSLPSYLSASIAEYASVTLIIASLLTTVSIFKEPSKQIVLIDFTSLIVSFLALVFLLSVYSIYVSFLIIVMSVMLAFRDVVRLRFHPKVNLFIFGFFPLIICFVLLGHIFDFSGIFFISLLVISNFIIVFMFNNEVKFSSIIDAKTFKLAILVLVAEMPVLLSGYLAFVAPSNFLSAEDFVEYRKLVAFFSVASPAGALALTYYLNKNVSLKEIRAFSIALGLCILAFLCSVLFYENSLFLVLVGSPIFILSASIHAINKIYASRLAYVFLSSISLIFMAGFGWIILFYHEFSVQIILCCVAISQALHALFSLVYLYFRRGGIDL